MKAQASRTTVISVCYNSTAVLPAMLASLPAGTPVVLVDNASRDQAQLAGLADGAGAVLVRNAENLGFGAACNLGAAGAATEFLLFLNPDAALEPGALSRLEDAMDRHPAVSACNPRIIEGDGKPFFKYKSYLLPRRLWMPKGWPDADTEVPVLSGAALFVRRRAFEQVGGFDPALFLFYEDDDISLRLARQCGPLMFIRDASVRHAGGASTPPGGRVGALKAWHMGFSRVHAARKHHQPFARARALTRASLQAIAPTVLLSRRKRPLFLAAWRGVWHACIGGDSSAMRP